MLRIFKKTKKDEQKIINGVSKDKNKNEVEVFFKSIENNQQEYKPWSNTRKNSDSEYSDTVFLNIHKKPAPRPDSPDIYPRYLSYNLGIYNPLKKFDDMLDEGMIEKTDNASALSTSKVAELKEILQSHNQPITEKKLT